MTGTCKKQQSLECQWLGLSLPHLAKALQADAPSSPTHSGGSIPAVGALGPRCTLRRALRHLVTAPIRWDAA